LYVTILSLIFYIINLSNNIINLYTIHTWHILNYILIFLISNFKKIFNTAVHFFESYKQIPITQLSFCLYSVLHTNNETILKCILCSMMNQANPWLPYFDSLSDFNPWKPIANNAALFSKNFQYVDLSIHFFGFHDNLIFRLIKLSNPW
jgi:hypothetical protein